VRVQLSKLSEEQKKGLLAYQQLSAEERVRYQEEAVYDKWARTGWLDLEDVPRAIKEKNPQRYAQIEEFHAASEFPKLKTEKARKNMALILENQQQFQMGRTLDVVNGKVALVQDTATSDEALPTKFALPIVRRAYALLMQRDFSVVQPLPGPSAYVFWLDFLRESDTTNILSVEYNWLLTPELGVPAKGKLQLNRFQLQVVKQLMGTTFTLEAQEDARAQLGLDIEQELITAFTEEFARNLMGRHLKHIFNSATGLQDNPATGASLVQPWLGPNTVVNIATRASLSLSITDYKQAIYNALIDADVNYQRANFRPTDTIIAGYAMAGFLQKMNTATQAQAPNQMNLASVGITDYGTYAGRWQIWGTNFLPDNYAILYVRNPAPLWAGHIYAPYVPLQVMPAIYGDYDTVTGNYQNKDAWTRNIRERSADITTKPYAFQPITTPNPPGF
jgi:major capsid protein Gp23